MSEVIGNNAHLGKPIAGAETWNGLGMNLASRLKIKKLASTKNKCCGKISNTLLNIPIHTKIGKFLMKITQLPSSVPVKFN